MQSNQAGRWAITALMWLGAIAISIASIESTNTRVDIPLVISMAMLFATIGTFLLWGLPEIAKMFTGNKTAAGEDDAFMEKTKRDGSSRRDAGSHRIEQLAVLLELMDEDEVADFKETLKHRVLDGMDEGDYLDDMLDMLRDESQTGKRLR
jgi:hypothetical protein